MFVQSNENAARLDYRLKYLGIVGGRLSGLACPQNVVPASAEQLREIGPKHLIDVQIHNYRPA
jgi:hypothetical protein